MNLTDYQKGVCQCRSCSSTFHQSEVVRIQTEHNGLERTCPHCGSNTYGVIDYPVSEYQLIFKNNEFYRLGKDQIEQMRIDNNLSTYYM